MTALDDEKADPGAQSELDGFELIFNPDGSVSFVDLPAELIEVALALDPDDPLVCERRGLLDV